MWELASKRLDTEANRLQASSHKGSYSTVTDFARLRG